MSPPKCQSFWGHKFEARFSYTPRSGAVTEGRFETSGMMVSDMERILRRNQTKTYHGDVCVRCGAVVNDTPQDIRTESK